MRPAKVILHPVRRTAIFAALAVLLTSTTVHADGRDVIARWAAHAAQTGLYTVDTGKVSQDGTKTIVENLEVNFDAADFAAAFDTLIGTDIARTFAGATFGLSIPALEADGLRLEDGRVRVDALSINSMTATGNVVDADPEEPGNQPLDLGETVYSDIAVVDASIALWPEVTPDPDRLIASLLPLAIAMSDFDFSSATMGRVATSQVDRGDGVAVLQTYGETRMGSAQGGQISTLSIDGYRTAASDAEQAFSMDMSVAGINAANYGWKPFFEKLLQPDDATYEGVVGSASMTGLDIAVSAKDMADGFKANVGSMTMTGLEARGAGFDIITTLDSWIASARKNKDFKPDEKDIVRVAAGLYGMFRLGDMQVSGVRASAKEVPNFTLGSAGIREISADGLGSAYMSGLEFDGPKGEIVRYGDSRIEEVTFPPLDALMDLERASEENDIPAILKAIPRIGRIANSGIQVRVPEENADFALGASILEMGDHIGPIPTRITSAFDGLDLPVAAMDREGREVFEGLGYERFNGSFFANLEWNPATTDLTIDAGTAMDKGGRIRLAATLGSVPKFVFEQPGPASVFALLGTTFKDARITYEDESLVERGVAFAARQQNVAEDQIRLMAAGMIPFMTQALGDPDLSAKLGEAAKTLLDGGNQLMLSAAAATPLPLAAIVTAAQQDPASALRLVQVDVKAQ